METVSHHGRETAYRRVDRGGSGPTLCLVHGSGANRRVWNGQLSLADRYPIVAPDLSGHGGSEDVDAAPGYQTLAAYADDVLATLEATDARVLVGSSMGGAIVQHLLVERDPDVDAAVLAGTGARLGVLEDLLTWLESDFERAVEFFHRPGRFFCDPDPELIERSADVLYETGRRVTYRDFLTCHRFDIRDRVAEIAVPTLAVYGSEDRLTPPWFHEFLAEEIPAGELAEIDDAAHLSMVERSEAFNEAIASFVEDRVAG
ncbi:alpha/beta fold hydrolase [Halovivax sp.]|uniref:alpha/beta fold hydrolase n=1 Tax=Halovivax sp. TaxID=1935978 RepID=UPI0025C4FCB7|nr:alpha/beta fold hydrolase [Halovivax sp.]